MSREGHGWRTGRSIHPPFRVWDPVIQSLPDSGLLRQFTRAERNSARLIAKVTLTIPQRERSGAAQALVSLVAHHIVGEEKFNASR